MSVPFTTPATAPLLAVSSTHYVARPEKVTTDHGRTQSIRAASAQGASAQDSVSLSAEIKQAYRVRQAEVQTSDSNPQVSHSSPTSVSPAEIRDLSSQMRRLSTEASQNRPSERTSEPAAAAFEDATVPAPLSDTIGADDGASPSFTSLAESPAQASTSGGQTGDDAQPSGTTGFLRPAESNPNDSGSEVDSAAGLSDLDHALGKIGHDRHIHGADSESLAEATRLSVHQRESLALGRGDGSGHQLAHVAARSERLTRLKKDQTAASTPAPGSVSHASRPAATKASRRA